MIPAYNESYLEEAMRNLGEAFDYAVNACHISADEFFSLFITTGFAERFGKCEPKVIVGLSGTELVMDIFAKAGLAVPIAKTIIDYECSPEYWCGYILAYYQWAIGKSFPDIHKVITAEEVLNMYPTLHEASEDKFVDVVNGIFARKKGPTKLQQQRKICGYSQSELAVKAGVNLRTLQQYETRAKDINKASVKTVETLAIVLGCRIEDLLE